MIAVLAFLAIFTSDSAGDLMAWVSTIVVVAMLLATISLLPPPPPAVPSGDDRTGPVPGDDKVADDGDVPPKRPVRKRHTRMFWDRSGK